MDFTKLGAEIVSSVQSFLHNLSFTRVVYFVVALILLSTGFKVLQVVVLRIVKKRVSAQSQMLLKKVIGYLGFTIITLVMFDALGFNVSAILGAAGIAGIAIGFAAQTSISNVISGIFLISEKPFAIGDVINTSEVTGVVVSIDILSVKIKTFDNTFVRIPNESIIKSKVVNVTRYPIRRLDIQLAVSYADDLQTVLQVLQEIAETNPYALRSPAPFLMVKEFAASGIELSLGIWFEKSQLLILKNSLMVEIQRRFKQEGITIPNTQIDENFSQK